MRAGVGVGYTRSQVARSRGNGKGPSKILFSILLLLALLPGLVAGMGMGGVAAAGAYYISGLPPVTDLHGLQVQTTKIYDRNGTLLYDLVDSGDGQAAVREPRPDFAPGDQRYGRHRRR